jgi:hypothetical protein
MADVPTISKTQNNTIQPGDSDRALVTKYKAEILAIMDMVPEQKKAVFKILGIDPDEIKNKPEYDTLQKQNKLNEKKMYDARKQVNATTLGATLAAFGGLLFGATRKKRPLFGDKPGIKGIFVALLTGAATLITYFFSTKLFTGRIARAGEVLSEKARNAEMVEIARALEQRDTSPTPSPSELSADPASESKSQAAAAPETADAKPSPSAVPPLPSFEDRVKQAADAQTAVGR